MITDVKLEQSENASLDMLVTLLGIITEVSAPHPEKA
jgi:hypothetical protein